MNKLHKQGNKTLPRSQIMALRTMSSTETLLYTYIRLQQTRLPSSNMNAELKSELSRLADQLETKVERLETGGPNPGPGKSPSSLDKLIRSFKSSFRCRGETKLPDLPPSVGSTSQHMSPPLEACPDPEELQANNDKPFPRVMASSSLANSVLEGRRAAIRDSIYGLQASQEGQQSLLRALLHQEALRVLDQCLVACLTERWGPQQGTQGESLKI